MRGGKRQNAGRPGIGGYKPICARLTKELFQALEADRKLHANETLPDAVRRLLSAALIKNEGVKATRVD